MLFSRQRTLLSLLQALGGRAGNLDFQKLLFLYCQGHEPKPSYQFVPYRYGGFSFTSYADRRKLTATGLLLEDSEIWALSESGSAIAVQDRRTLSGMRAFCDRYSQRGDALVALAYQRYPYFAIRSEIVSRLGLSKEDVLRIKSACPTPREPALLTIGYEGRCLEEYLNKLILAGVTVLCDVRRNPLSRKYGFSKGTLSHACDGLSIAYRHLPELGIESAARKELNSKAAYKALFQSYKVNCLPHNLTALTAISEWLSAGERVALTCFELEAESCHRHCVADEVERLNQKKFPTIHL